MKAPNYRNVEVYRFEDQAGIPNHLELPFLIYADAFKLKGNVNGALERTYLENHWVGFHRRRVPETYHFQFKAHEVLGVSRGFATVKVGGPRDKKVELETGGFNRVARGNPAAADYELAGSSGYKRLP